jgi:hypothetical protein
MLAKLLLTLAMMGAVHTGPYTVREPVVTLSHGHASDLVTFHDGNMCEGGRYSYVYLVADSSTGATQGVPGHYRDGHLSFSLDFLTPATWTIVDINAGCTDGSWGQYDGVHPVITVRR